MHPILTHRYRLALYGLAWLCVGCVLALLFRAATPRSWWGAVAFVVPLALVYAPVALSAWWVCKSAPLGATSLARGTMVVAGAALVAAAFWVAAGTAWRTLLQSFAERHPSLSSTDAAAPPAVLLPGSVDARDALLLLALGTMFYLGSAAVHYLLITFETARTAERRALESQVLARDAEVRALRAQLNPHFLFNSLNSINALVGSDPEGARRMCEGLGHFLRATLALASQESVPLRDEVQLVQRYLDIEKVRFGERLQRALFVAQDAGAARIPPLLLQPLVENAVKHGIAGCVEGGTIRIEAAVRGGVLHLVVTNPYDAEVVSPRGEGMGLANVRRRLQASGARQARLQVYKGDGQYRVELSLHSASPDGRPQAEANR